MCSLYTFVQKCLRIRLREEKSTLEVQLGNSGVVCSRAIEKNQWIQKQIMMYGNLCHLRMHMLSDMILVTESQCTIEGTSVHLSAEIPVQISHQPLGGFGKLLCQTRCCNCRPHTAVFQFQFLLCILYN